MLALCEEIRESRRVVENVPIRSEQVIPEVPREPESTPDRAARGQLMVAFLAMTGVAVLLAILCIILALT